MQCFIPLILSAAFLLSWISSIILVSSLSWQEMQRVYKVFWGRSCLYTAWSHRVDTLVCCSLVHGRGSDLYSKSSSFMPPLSTIFSLYPVVPFSSSSAAIFLLAIVVPMFHLLLVDFPHSPPKCLAHFKFWA